MLEEERLRLQAIADRIRLLQGWTEGLAEAEFVADVMLRDASALSLMVIGETAKRVLDSTKRRSPEIPWPAIVSLRNRIAHGYETVDHQLVWQIITLDLPRLALASDRLLSQTPASSLDDRSEPWV